MDKRLARKNMRMGIVLFLVLWLMMGIAFLWASLYNHFIQ
jgi:hypothetical protein